MDEDSLVENTVNDDLANRQRHPNKRPIRNWIGNKAKNAIKKMNKSARAKLRATLFKKVGLSACWGLPLFLTVVILVGIISFITTMPGMVQEEILKKMLDGLNNLNYSLTGSDHYLQELAEDTNRTRQKEVLKYLDDMGFDPVGFGFVASFTRDKDYIEYSPSLFDDEPSMADYEAKWGPLLDLLAASDYNDAQAQYIKDNDLIFNYIASNERAYLVHDEDKIGNVVKGLLGYKGYTGMIETKVETNNEILGLEFVTDWDDSTITVDREARQMVISSLNTEFKEFTTAEQKVRYDLDSYTSRYGMPLEFLLALHLGTMSPELTSEIVKNENLQTVVRLIALKDEYVADYDITYTTDDGVKEELPIPYGTKYDDELKDIMITGDKVKYDAKNNEFVFDFSDEDIKKLKEVISIKALHKWIENINNLELKATVNEPFIVDSTNSAKESFLGDGMYRVIYKVQANYYDDMTNWRMSSWFGNVNFYGDEGGEWIYTSHPERPEDMSLWVLGQMEGTMKIESAPSRYMQEFLVEGTDTIYVGTMSEKPILITVDEDMRTRSLESLTSEGEYYTPDADAEYTTGILHGVQYYLDGHADEVREEYVKMGITCLLSQLDSYLYRNGLEKVSDYKFTQVEPNKYFNVFGHNLIRSDWAMDNSLKDLELLLTQHWLDFWNEHSSPSDSEIYEELRALTNNINTYFDLIGNKESYTEKLIKQLFEELDLDLKITVDDINTICEAMDGALSSYEYVSPRIAYVVRHWYKDIIFEIPEDDKIESAYETVAKEIRLPYKLPEENNRMEVTIVLNPEGKKQKDNIYQQKRQPYVVKGDVVYLDGEKQENTGLEDGKKTVKTDAGEYTIGDGYRTMKRLMTQGQYYVLDGTRETAKSIMWCKKLENITGGVVRVKNGRILSIRDRSGDNEEVDQETAIANVNNTFVSIEKIGEEKVGKKKDTADEDGEEESNAGEDEGEGIIYEYRVSKSATPYISVGNKYENYSDEEVIAASKKSVETINKMLEDLGVYSRRELISFDNRTMDGDVVTLTAFGLLEGMHTEPAQYIYRDFKEMLIEFGYYTKAEFDSLNKDVLKWFLPEYTVNTEAEAINWRQNKEEDSLDYGAVIYPISESEFKKGNDGSRKKAKSADEEDTEKDKLGIKPGMEVIAPGNCTVENKDGAAVLTFDGISQPEIGVVDRYQMTIEGITLSVTGAVNAGDTIGSTTGEKVKVILKNNLGGYVDNVEDYMRPNLNLGNIVMIDMKEEEIIELIWQFEGTIDADPDDGDYYTVDYPANDAPTVGHGVTAATEPIWHELGYSEYISGGQFVKKRIPKEVVDDVSRVTTEEHLQHLEDMLDANGVVWGGNQKAAWVSLYYNGWHSTVDSIVEDWGNGDFRTARDKWLGCWEPAFEQGHKNRRAQEWVLFCTGELLSQEEAYNLCYVTKEY